MARSLTTSSTPAASMEKTEMTRPMPIRCSWVNPRGRPVTARTAGTMRRSYTGTQTMTLRVSKMESDAAGMEKCGPMLASSVFPWRTNMVLICPYTVANTIPLAQIGSSRTTLFSSSTCVTVHSRHADAFAADLSSGVSTAALSRHANCPVCSSLRLPSMPDSLSSVSCSRDPSAGTSTPHFLADATSTCAILVSGLPPGRWCLYSGVPTKKLATATAMTTAGMPNPHPHPTCVCTYTSTDDATSAPMLMEK
ncbi:Os01g0142875 [Oryza sativa Japonica Group]|uniref:Os01g0142875 protein n=1 Tax=Oryza sativa subsp. japonica TaxID=39947 RepID=A0A0P0UXU7_ORYSJ|nr:hypothetical protein EE612_000212 [Oryza sativa]BAS70334.1 Os01g0142875 [Oryza sativa Japonica Group]